LIRDKEKNRPVGYGFVEFRDKKEAQEVFQTLNGKQIPDHFNRVYKLNWASHGGGVARAGVSPMGAHGQSSGGGVFPSAQAPEGYQIYVGDLSPQVTNINLMQAFKERFPSVFEAKVICDPVSRESKGYGFIKFAIKEESEEALRTMSGKEIMGRPIKLNYASQRNKGGN